MKKNIILACICAVVGLSACDNYLDIVPKGKAVLNTTEDYLGLLEPVDAEYTIDNFNYTSNEQAWNNMAELESYKYPISSAGFFWDEGYDRAGNITDNESLTELYNKCYARIARYNILIDNMGDAEGPESEKTMGIAQAKAMRAYNYFFLVNTFAKPYNPSTAATDNGIIIRTKFDLEEVGKQYSVADTYAFILKDLDEAVGNLPEKSVNAYQPDRAFGYAFRAKVHLFMRNIDNALSDALEVLKFSNHELWDLSAELSAYLEKNPSFGTNDSMLYMMFRMDMMMNPHKYSHPENLLYCPNRTGGAPAILRKHLKDTFDAAADLRYNLICNPTMPDRPTAEPGCLYFMNSTIILLNESGIRLSEVYLMIAECYARQGNIDLALKYLNDLRKTRFYSKYYQDLVPTDVDNNKDKALTYIRQERARELFTSCNSFFDMRRFCTEFNETLTKTYTDTNGSTHTYTLKPDSHLLTFPFPIKAMQTTNLIQNSK
ncbi:hypothetical protein F070042J6_47080 [Bacteroides sp. f07]|uniref:RagB/SusD family nutrient uptake outer membrane protein n=1 Tax=Bacteroides sp. f07 TaxID=3132704 RepID=UPI0034A8C9F8